MGSVLTFLKRSVPLQVGVIFIVAGITTTYVSFNEWQAARRFEREALTARASIVAKSIESANRENGTSTRYVVAYRFTARDGATLEHTEDIPVDDWEQLAEGDPLDIRYLPDEPASARTRAPFPMWVRALTTFGPSLFVVIGCLLVRPAVRRLLVIRRLQHAGVSAEADVVEVFATNTTVNRVRQWQLRYEFRDQAGRAQRGESDFIPPHEAAEWQVGDRGAVRYDPARPADNVLVGRA